MVKAIIFDFDGVIHDTPQISYNINKELDPALSLEEFKKFFEGNVYENGKNSEESIDQLFKKQEATFKELVIPKMHKDVLQEIRRRYDKMFIISSNKEHILEEYLNRNGLGEIFDEILGVDTHRLKEEKFKMILGKYPLSPDKCIFIADTLGDLLEAQKIGIPTIAVDFGLHEKERLEKGSPEKIISSFEEIIPAIEEIEKNLI